MEGMDVDHVVCGRDCLLHLEGPIGTARSSSLDFLSAVPRILSFLEFCFTSQVGGRSRVAWILFQRRK